MAVCGYDYWLACAYQMALKEYEEYWCTGNHIFKDIGLSRFYEDSGDNWKTRHTEASWDMSPRYDDEDTTDLAPIDLNANLYLYEVHFSQHFSRTGELELADKFKNRAESRKQKMRELLWCEEDGLFYDYNTSTQGQKKVKSVASFVPMWAGMVDDEHADKLVKNLSLFEHQHGLSTCDNDYGYNDRQWNYPIGWAPLHWMVYEGLKKYGYEELAYRIAEKWLDLNVAVFEKTSLMWEKYDVVNGKESTIFDRYPPQHGFGWTNGVFLYLVNELQAR
ncbi:MAG TPA: hypothetical protein ENG03_00140 [Thioploca sp.]|nr:hypothetical protein [Thioploca sp.]